MRVKDRSVQIALAIEVTMSKRSRSDPVDDDSHAGLGDIMGGSSLNHTELRQPLHDFSPMQRVVLSANGNLQRLVSSYYNSPVTVTVRRHEKTGDGEYAREVAISVFGITFCAARSTIKITRPEVIKAIEGGVAIGQLFRHLCVLPSFSLHAAAFLGEDMDDPVLGDAPAFWRDYTLEGEGVECRIEETLRNDLFALQPPAPAVGPEEGSGGMFGDIMAPAVTGMELPDGFEPKARGRCPPWTPLYDLCHCTNCGH